MSRVYTLPFNVYLHAFSSPGTTSQRMDRGIRKVTSLWGEVSEIIFNAKLYDKKPAEEDEDEDIDKDAEDLTPEEMEYLAEKRE